MPSIIDTRLIPYMVRYSGTETILTCLASAPRPLIYSERLPNIPRISPDAGNISNRNHFGE